jgi:hypothetical protein
MAIRTRITITLAKPAPQNEGRAFFLPVFETHYSNHVAIWRLAGAADPLAVSDKVSQLRLPLCDSAIDCVQFFGEWAVFRQDLCQ